MSLVRKGDTGIAVGRVQQKLIEAGYNVPQPEMMAIQFGDGTYDAVRSFQASHVGPGGRPLSEDGIVGDETWWALQHPGGDAAFIADGWSFDASTVRDVIRPTLVIAAGEIGVREDPDGSNDGPQIRQYTDPGFIGDPWCALFASWAFEKGMGACPFGRLAATWAIYEWAQQHGFVLGDAAIVQPGDVLLILRGDRNDPKRRGHTMICCTNLGGGKLATIAGNESNAVRGGIRDRSALSAIVRVVPL